MSLFEAVVLGVVQGLTEFLPVSSSAHLRVVPALLGWEDPGAAYSAVIQLGTVAAVLLYFSKDLVRLTKAFVTGLFKGAPFATEDSRLAWAVGVGTIPIGVLGLLLKSQIETRARSLYLIAAMFIIFGLVLWFVERRAVQQRTLAESTFKDGVVVGLWQSLALMPGVSRSGATISGALALGFKRADAARYSFLLSIPSTTLAGLLKLKDVTAQANRPSDAALVVGTAVSFVVGLAAISGLLRYVRTQSMTVFVGYRLLVGVALLGLLGAGVLQPY